MKSKKEALEQFVAREIFACQTNLIEELLRKHIFSVYDIENLYRPFDGELLSPTVCFSCYNEFPFLDSETGLCEQCYEDSIKPQEIYEWWLLSDWLGRKLQIEAEPVIVNEYGVWWGRTTTGQAISMDIVIEKVFEDIYGE